MTGTRELFTRHLGLRLVDVARRTWALGVLAEIRKSDFASINALRDLQFERLRELLRHCKREVPYYQRVFGDSGFDPDRMQALEDITVLPVLTKDDIRNNFDELKAVRFNRFYPRIKETGGSTGEPLRLYHDEASHSAMWANIYRGFGFAGYRLGEKYLTVTGGSLLPKRLGRGRDLYFWLQNSLVCPSYHLQETDLQRIADQISRHGPAFVYGYSSSLYRAARYILEKDLRVSGLRAVLTTADMLFAEQRTVIEKAFSAPVYDNYGCPEAGIMTWECNRHDGYHYNMETCYLEIVDPDAAGLGRVVSTNLMNRAFPLVRYDSGDVGALKRAGRCACGRSHDKVVSLVGRQRDIISLRSGRMVHGAFFNHLPLFYENEDIVRFQIVQPSWSRLEVHVELRECVSLEKFLHMSSAIQQLLDNEVEVEVVEGEFRESLHSGKHRSVVSDVDNLWTCGACD